jgi:hypothetical protein
MRVENWQDTGHVKYVDATAEHNSCSHCACESHGTLTQDPATSKGNTHVFLELHRG